MKTQTIAASLLLLVAGAGLAFAATIMWGPAPTSPVASGTTDSRTPAATDADDESPVATPASDDADDDAEDRRLMRQVMERLSSLERDLADVRTQLRARRASASGSGSDASGADGTADDDLAARLAVLEESAQTLTDRVQQVEANQPLELIGEEELVGLLDHDDPVIRRRALNELRRRRSELGIEAAIRFADDPDDSVREAAAEYFEDVPDPRGHEALLKLARDKNVEIADDALDALGERSDAQALAALEEVYRTAEDPRVAYSAGRNRQRAARDNDNAPPFEPQVDRWRALLTDSDADNRETAVWALGRFGSEADIPHLRAMAEDPEEDVRRAARRTLRRWGVDADEQ